MKKLDLKVVTLSPSPVSEVRQHLNNSIASLFNDDSPVTGYALVTFHENKSYGTCHHTTKAGIHQVDLPDMVAARLRNNITKMP